MLGDLGHEINRKGLLHTTPEKQVDGIKLAYYGVKNTIAVFDDSLERVSHVGTVQVFENVPIYDSPVLIVERNLVLK